jgi:tRNA threonylcarbamoyl adenosine modification protein (Sua5/YciO/YrdC/YwlC family)
MADWFELHPENPQKRFIDKTVEALRAGGLIAYPTDSCYAFGCHLDDKTAADRLRQLRQFDKHHQFTLVCRDLSEIAQYAKVDNQAFRLLKRLTPGAYTFILPASKELPRRLSHEKRKTIGIRIPDHPVVKALLDALNEPLISCTLQWPDESEPVRFLDDCRNRLLGGLDVVLDGGDCGLEPTTVIDLSTGTPSLVRQGKGDTDGLF